MPKRTPKRSSYRRRMVNRRRPTRSNSSRSSQRLKVHRRCAVYPKTTASTWLDTLSWYGSIALKLFQTIYGVTDDLHATSAVTGAGTTILLGPGDFAASSIVASQVFTASDKEVQACRAIPFERCTLRHVKIKIVPSVDLGSRGGMYAACVIPVDSQDANYMQEDIVKKYTPDFDAIIRNPTAKMAQVTTPLTLSINSRTRPVDIRVNEYTTSVGWINAYPQYALMIAYSDLATNTAGAQTHYQPASSLFEVHLTGDIILYEPSEVHPQVEKPTKLYESFVTLKLSTTDSKNINTKFLNRSWDLPDGDIDLRDLPVNDAERILSHYDRHDLIPKLRLSSRCNSLNSSIVALNIDDG